MNDPYLDIIDAQWSHIARAYNVFKDKQPILEYRIASEKIYSFPANDYINDLSARTREQTRKQYVDACKINKFLLFVRDEINQKLKSYILDIP